MSSEQIANDDWPILVARVVAVGNKPATIYCAYRDVLGVTPAEAKRLITLDSVEVARGCRMDIECTVKRFQRAGATVVVTIAD